MNPSTRGFTLLELLIALAISSMVLGASFSAYVATTRAWDKCRVRADHYQSARVALGTMETYLKAALLPGDQPHLIFDGASDTSPDGRRAADRLTFCSTGGMVAPERRQRIDLCEVAFHLNDDPEKPEPGLVMEKQPLPGAMPVVGRREKAELAPNVVEFDVTYFDGAQWLKEWSAQPGLPRAVQISLTLADPAGAENPVRLSRLITLRTAAMETAP